MSHRRTFILSALWMMLLPPLIVLLWQEWGTGAALAALLLSVLPVWLALPGTSPFAILLDLGTALLAGLSLFLLLWGLGLGEFLLGPCWALSVLLGWRLLRSGAMHEAEALQAASPGNR